MTPSENFCANAEFLFCLDAIQTLGAFSTTVEHVDFLAADAHKWLLGPCAAGIFYARRELQEKLNPPIYGWHNVRNPNFVAQEKIEFRRTRENLKPARKICSASSA